MPTGSQNDANMEPKIIKFSNVFKTDEKYEIKLPLGQEHDLTGSALRINKLFGSAA